MRTNIRHISRSAVNTTLWALLLVLVLINWRDWDTIRPSGPSPIGFVASSGSFSIAVSVMKSEAPR